MSYKISGNVAQETRILVINESDWSVESNTIEHGDYEITVTEGDKIIIGRLPDGQSTGFGSVGSEEIIIPGGTRGVFAGGYDWGTSSVINVMEYITISTTGDATDFGDLLTVWRLMGGASNATNDRGVFAGGYEHGGVGAYNDNIEYITISTPGNSQDFGDLTFARGSVSASSNGTNDRAVFWCGADGPATSRRNILDYITISTPANAVDFGDSAPARTNVASTSNGVNDRGVSGGGWDTSSIVLNILSYITISTTGDASDFGDLTRLVHSAVGVSNKSNERAVFGGGNPSGSSWTNIMDYITISSTGNAADFGDLVVARRSHTGLDSGTNDRGVFAGGGTSAANGINGIEYITISTTGDSTDFGDLNHKPTGTSAVSDG